MYTHRGAYLNALGEVSHHQHNSRSVYLWTLPMFHCNGWCMTWGVTAAAGRHVCLPAVRGEEMWRLIEEEEVTHLSGAPVVLSTLVESSTGKQLPGRLVATIAGAPPSPTIIEALEAMGADLIHVYGLTETYGPYTICERQEHWSELDGALAARLLARQGVGMVQAERARVVDPDMNDVPADGTTMGEIVMRGNNVMKGYFGDDAGDGRRVRGRMVSLRRYRSDAPRRLRSVARSRQGRNHLRRREHLHGRGRAGAAPSRGGRGRGGRRACQIRNGERFQKRSWSYAPEPRRDEADLIAFARDQIAHFKAPKSVEFVAELPRTTTGKVQKFELREREWAAYDARIKG